MKGYRQNVEGELAAIVFALAGVFLMIVGIIWAVAFAARWWMG